jgi:hypothetical protein
MMLFISNDYLTDFHVAPSQTRALVTNGIRFVPQERRVSVCGSAAGVALLSPNHRPKLD